MKITANKIIISGEDWNGWKKLPNGRAIREKKIKEFEEMI